ncbi:unnamed protein product [Arctogadus glacialis]
MVLARLVFAPGPCEVEWSWTHANKRFVLSGQKQFLSFSVDSYSNTARHCFPFVASCHSSCQSLIRTTSFRSLISHFSNLLTLPNEIKREREREREGERKKERERDLEGDRERKRGRKGERQREEGGEQELDERKGTEGENWGNCYEDKQAQKEIIRIKIKGW